jgi:hypothetical protein
MDDDRVRMKSFIETWKVPSDGAWQHAQGLARRKAFNTGTGLSR